MSSMEVRRKIHQVLYKREAMNALARAIFFGKQGELRERAYRGLISVIYYSKEPAKLR
ncbi:Tn3 family transposase [Paenibacillus sp. FSL R7-0189]